MPRLSIIVAHQNDQRLEETLLSVLENRPHDCEVLVAHDGSYADPYQLADEVLFVEANDCSSLTAKLNEAIYAACSPVVHVLGEGVTVSEGWCDGPCYHIQKLQQAAVSPLIHATTGAKLTYAGLNPNAFATRGLLTAKNSIPQSCAGPTLAAGFYSRRLLLGLGGFLERVDSSVADVDLALCLHHNDTACAVDETSVVYAKHNQVATSIDAGRARDLARLLVAHEFIKGGVVAGIQGSVSWFLRNLLNPSQWAPAMSWGMGIASNELTDSVHDRLAAWNKSQQQVSSTLQIYREAVATQSNRRAA